MTIGGPITVLQIGEDYLPIGRADLSDLTDSEAGALLKILMTSDHSNMLQNKRRKELYSVLEYLLKKGYILHMNILIGFLKMIYFQILVYLLII